MAYVVIRKTYVTSFDGQLHLQKTSHETFGFNFGDLYQMWLKFSGKKVQKFLLSTVHSFHDQSGHLLSLPCSPECHKRFRHSVLPLTTDHLGSVILLVPVPLQNVPEVPISTLDLTRYLQSSVVSITLSQHNILACDKKIYKS